MGYSFRLAARVLLYASSHRQDNTYHSLCYTSHGALAGTRNSSMGPPHEGSIQQPIAHERHFYHSTAFRILNTWFRITGCVSLIYMLNCIMCMAQVRSECLTCTFRASCCSAHHHGHRFRPSPVPLVWL